DGEIPVVKAGLFLIRIDLLGLFDAGVASLFDAAPGSGSDAGQKRHAIRRPFRGIGQYNRKAIDIGLKLPPEFAARSAAAGADLCDGDAHLLDDLQGIAHAEGDAFHERSDEHVARGSAGDADPSAAGTRVGMRATFA